MSIYYCPSCDLYRGEERSGSDTRKIRCHQCGSHMPRVGCES